MKNIFEGFQIYQNYLCALTFHFSFAISYLSLSQALGHEGIFRINGSSKIVDKLRLQYDRHGNANLEEAGGCDGGGESPQAVLPWASQNLSSCPQLHAQFLIVQEGMCQYMYTWRVSSQNGL